MRIIKLHDTNTLRIRRKLTVFPNIMEDGIYILKFDWVAETFDKPESTDLYLLLYLWNFDSYASMESRNILKTINTDYGKHHQP